MSPESNVVVGIDVGGETKGFHAVALRNRVFEKTTSTDPEKVVDWCLEWKANIVAVDAPLRLEPIDLVQEGGAGIEFGRE